MLIIACGHQNGQQFSCSLLFNGPIGNPKEAIHLMMVRKKLFSDWIEAIILVHEERVLRYWTLANKDWEE